MTLVPVVWAVLTSFKRPVDAFAVPPKFMFPPTFEFHYQVWVEKRFWRYLINIRSCPRAWWSSRFQSGRWRLMACRGYGAGRRAEYVRDLVDADVSQILLAIPFFVLAKMTGLINTYPALIFALIAINQPFTIWLMRSFFLDVPHELYEAAEIAGVVLGRCSLGVGFACGTARCGGDSAVQPAAGL